MLFKLKRLGEIILTGVGGFVFGLLLVPVVIIGTPLIVGVTVSRYGKEFIQTEIINRRLRLFRDSIVRGDLTDVKRRFHEYSNNKELVKVSLDLADSSHQFNVSHFLHDEYNRLRLEHARNDKSSNDHRWGRFVPYWNSDPSTEQNIEELRIQNNIVFTQRLIEDERKEKLYHCAREGLLEGVICYLNRTDRYELRSARNLAHSHEMYPYRDINYARDMAHNHLNQPVVDYLTQLIEGTATGTIGIETR